jgi:hypothetical protein
MARGPCTFRQRDVTAAFKGAVAAGIAAPIVVIDKKGNIRIHAGSGAKGDGQVEENEWDAVYGEDQVAVRQ